LDFNWDIRSDSDHHSFFARSIPFLMVHTGKHGDYHRPSDDSDKINADGLKQIAQLLFGVLVELADAPTLAGFRAASRGESRGVQRAREQALSPLPGRLGVRWNEATADKTGAIVVDQVTPGSAADKAGVRAGDRFLKFAGRDVSGAPQFRLSVLAAGNPVAATLERPSAAEPVEISLELKGGPARLGVSWLVDDAEPGSVIVNRVTPGSAADQAGVRVGDRIYRIDGRDFTDGEEFRQRAVAVSGPVSLEIESAGRVRSLVLPGIDGDSASAAVDAPAP
jgi:membrane-associated protease RseP (regulator of RpoE activity)